MNMYIVCVLCRSYNATNCMIDERNGNETDSYFLCCFWRAKLRKLWSLHCLPNSISETLLDRRTRQVRRRNVLYCASLCDYAATITTAAVSAADDAARHLKRSANYFAYGILSAAAIPHNKSRREKNFSGRRMRDGKKDTHTHTHTQ